MYLNVNDQFKTSRYNLGSTCMNTMITLIKKNNEDDRNK